MDDLAAPGPDERLLALDAALTRLAASKPEHAALLEMCHFGALTTAEAAAALGLSCSTAERRIRYAKARIRVDLEG